jgi:hypothetical protein
LTAYKYVKGSRRILSMPKVKTNKAAAKRFKKTGGGAVKES